MNDDDLRVIPDTLAPPMWYRYLTYIDPANNHRKYYEVSITMTDEGKFVVKKRWGRQPDRLDGGQSQSFNHDTVQRAISVAQTYTQTKIAQGYVETPRPGA